MSSSFTFVRIVLKNMLIVPCLVLLQACIGETIYLDEVAEFSAVLYEEKNVSGADFIREKIESDGKSFHFIEFELPKNEKFIALSIGVSKRTSDVLETGEYPSVYINTCESYPNYPTHILGYLLGSEDGNVLENANTEEGFKFRILLSDTQYHSWRGAYFSLIETDPEICVAASSRVGMLGGTDVKFQPIRISDALQSAEE